jgi:hypothetical protein
MAGRTVNIRDLVDSERLAVQIADLWDRWNKARDNWLTEKRELRNYIFQTSTRDTSNRKLPWKNSTTTPKICQIRDNLHANYMAALFPNENWLTWRGNDRKAEEKGKRTIIQEYMRNKTEASTFRGTVSQLIYDWIDYGILHSTTEYVKDSHKDPISGEEIMQYCGPKLVRIDPKDIVFNLMAASYDDSPKIIRSLKSLGDIARDMETNPALGYMAPVFTKMLDNRKIISSMDRVDAARNEAFQIDGFGNIFDYFSSGMVEVLEFFGDIWDEENGELLSNYVITVVDRCHVLRKQKIPGWNTHKFRSCGWRLRPDSLLSMGPLDNLVGMQYRIDHLENLKADVFDLIAHPVMKIKGFVEDFEYGPGERIVCGDDGDVAFMPPDTTALNADMQIRILEDKMEEFAGAPRQAMGIRTPGEKTATEVQILDNASGRIFQNKTNYLEQMWLEPTLNDMLEVSRQSLDGTDIIRVLDDEVDVALFKQITREDITANGRLRPIGARHFATKANLLQNFLALAASPAASDPAVNVHISGKGIAEMIEELSGLSRFELVSPNIRVAEQLETQKLVNAGSEAIATETQIPAGVTADESMQEDMNAPPDQLAP